MWANSCQCTHPVRHEATLSFIWSCSFLASWSMQVQYSLSPPLCFFPYQPAPEWNIWLLGCQMPRCVLKLAAASVVSLLQEAHRGLEVSGWKQLTAAERRGGRRGVMRAVKLNENRESFTWKIINDDAKRCKNALWDDLSRCIQLLVHCVCLSVCRIMQKNKHWTILQLTWLTQIM